MNQLTLPEAARLSGKSIQTIRRMVKAKKVRSTKEKTPQGYIYLIDRESLEIFIKKARTPMGIREEFEDELEKFEEEIAEKASGNFPADGKKGRIHRPISRENIEFYKREFERFNINIQKLIDQNQKDKENFFKLIHTFQERVGVLENQIKLLEAPKKKWWQIKVL